MEKIKLNAKKRKIVGRKVKNLRKQGFIPAVLYGKDQKPILIELDKKDFEKIYEMAGSSSLVDLKIDDNQEIKVLVQDTQYDPVIGDIMHADFYAIKMDEKITTQIPIKFIGISPAVKDLEGNFIANYDEIEVECLPADLIPEINVDISVLKTFEDQVKVSELNIPQAIKVLVDQDEVVALVNPPRSEEELEELESETAADTEKETVEKMESEAEEERKKKEESKEENKTEKQEPKEDKSANK
jgi:large subunit ribosomal protein L25